ncbi:MAG TPA: ATP phosphoribosyltransferase, partial [Caulobacteraceae bacterium]
APARARARRTAALAWPPEADKAAREALAAFRRDGAKSPPHSLLVGADDLFDAAAALADAGVAPVSVTRPEYVFAAQSQPIEDLAARLSL